MGKWMEVNNYYLSDKICTTDDSIVGFIRLDTNFDIRFLTMGTSCSHQSRRAQTCIALEREPRPLDLALVQIVTDCPKKIVLNKDKLSFLTTSIRYWERVSEVYCDSCLRQN